MNSALVHILGNIYFWIFIGSMLCGIVALRLGNSNRDQAAFADFPDKPEKYLFRSRIFYSIAAVFFLAVLAGLVITGYQVLQVVQPQFSFEIPEISAAVERTAVPSGTAESLEEAVEITDAAPTLVPTPTNQPEPTATTVAGEYAAAVVGNTNFQGVNVRLEASVGAEIVAKLSNQTKVFVFSEPTIRADGYVWRKVRTEDGVVGWIAEPFLIFNDKSK